MKKNYNIPTTECLELYAINSLMAASYADPHEQDGGNTNGGLHAPGRKVF